MKIIILENSEDEVKFYKLIESLKDKKKAVDSSKIKMLLTDCDGCLTDGGMYYSENGDELKKFNTKDGMGFSLLKKKGIITGIITGENVELNRRRAEKMNVDELHMGITDKLSVIEKLSKKYDVAMEEIAYIGDDINDLDVIKAVGLGCCPADAMPQVKSAAKYVATAHGGEGVIREVAEMILSSTMEQGED